MMMNLTADNRIRAFLQKGEKVLWSGEPSRGKPLEMAKFLSKIFAYFGMFLLLLAIWLLLEWAYVNGYLPNVKPDPQLTARYSEGRNIVAVFLTSMAFLLSRRYLHKFAHAEKTSVYAITNYRVLIVDENDQASSYGPGEVTNPTIFSNRDNTKDLFFHEKIAVRGSLEVGSERKDKEWSGFADLSEEAAAQAIKELKNWLKDLKSAPEKITNSALTLRFEFKPHRNWTIQSFEVATDRLDYLPFALFASQISGTTRYVKEPNIADEWNLMLMSRQVDSKAAREEAALSYLTISIECAQSFRAPQGIKRLSTRKDTDINALIREDRQFIDIVGQNMLVCRLNQLFSKDEPPKILIHENAKNVRFTDDLTSYELIGNINIMGNGIRLRQVYSYYTYPASPGEEPYMVHFRHTFWCEERFFKENNNKLNDIIKSTRILLPVSIEN